MVHVARGQFAEAEQVLAAGISFEDAGERGSLRLPGNGLHWLLGLLRLAAGDQAAARAEFDKELARAERGLLGQEYAMDACVGHAYARLRSQDMDAACAMFEQALSRFPEHARSWLGLADVRYRQGRRAETEAALSRGLDAIDALRAQGRAGEAALAAATAELLAGRSASSIEILGHLLAESPASHAGWSIPVEPAFAALANEPGFKSVLDKLAERAS
jgi:tetratricopeptide (TPR) repeat protein